MTPWPHSTFSYEPCRDISYRFRLTASYTQDLTSVLGLLTIAHDPSWCQLDSGVLTLGGEYRWDGCSGPTFDVPESIRASCIHDALYRLMREGRVPAFRFRRAADEAFFRILREDGMAF